MASSSISRTCSPSSTQSRVSYARYAKTIHFSKLPDYTPFSSPPKNRASSLSTSTGPVTVGIEEQESSYSCSPGKRRKDYGVIHETAVVEPSSGRIAFDEISSDIDWKSHGQNLDMPTTQVHPQFQLFPNTPEPQLRESPYRSSLTAMIMRKTYSVVSVDREEENSSKAFMTPFWEVEPGKMILSQTNQAGYHTTHRNGGDGVPINSRVLTANFEDAKKGVEEKSDWKLTLASLPFSIRREILASACRFLPSAEYVSSGELSRRWRPSIIYPDLLVWKQPGRDEKQAQNARIEPESFFRLSAAEKKEFYSSPIMNRIISNSNYAQTLPTAAAVPRNSSIEASSSNNRDLYPIPTEEFCAFTQTAPATRRFEGPMDFQQFQDFCSVAEPMPVHYHICVSLWDPTAYVQSTEELLVLLRNPHQLLARDPYYAGEVNGRYDTVLQKRDDILKQSEEWATAMRALPKWVRKISVLAHIPFFFDRKDLEVNLVRMNHYAAVRTGSRVRFEWDISYHKAGEISND